MSDTKNYHAQRDQKVQTIPHLSWDCKKNTKLRILSKGRNTVATQHGAGRRTGLVQNRQEKLGLDQRKASSWGGYYGSWWLDKMKQHAGAPGELPERKNLSTRLGREQTDGTHSQIGGRGDFTRDLMGAYRTLEEKASARTKRYA